jgi:hypothetical protein
MESILGFLSSYMRVVGCGIRSKPHLFSIDTNIRTPFFTSRYDTLVSTGVIGPHTDIAGILGFCGQAKIRATIIEAMLVVDVIDQISVSRSRHDRFSWKRALSISTA